MFMKKTPIFAEMLQAVLLFKNYHLIAYENCLDDIGLELKLKD